MSDRLADLLMALPVFILSLSLHEYMHAWAADRLGDPTPRAMGRLTVNPRAHLDPLGTVMFILSALYGFFIGWAKPVPVNHFNFRHPRRDFAFVAVSGPGANFMQAVAWYLLLRLVLLAMPAFSPLGTLLRQFTLIGVIVNVALLCFNIIPIPPLDGSRVLAWLLPPRQAAVLDRMEPFGFVVLLLLLYTGILGMIYSPLLSWALHLFPGL